MEFWRKTMNKLKQNLTLRAALSMAFVIALAAAAFGQKYDETKTADKDLVNRQAVNASKTAIAPLDLSSEKDAKPVARTTFVKRVTLNLNGLGVNIVAMQIPRGKRLVIENVTALVRSPETQRVEVNYFTYQNNGGAADKTIHRLALEKQASFKDSAIFAASRNAAVMADEQIGSEHFSVGISARIIGGTASYAQAQFTFSGYLEDLPAK
jgi:hypothetical protein